MARTRSARQSRSPPTQRPTPPPPPKAAATPVKPRRSRDSPPSFTCPIGLSMMQVALTRTRPNPYPQPDTFAFPRNTDPTPTPTPNPDLTQPRALTLSLPMMQDPVVCVDGHSYERVNIERWFRESSTSPATGAPVSASRCPACLRTLALSRARAGCFAAIAARDRRGREQPRAAQEHRGARAAVLQPGLCQGDRDRRPAQPSPRAASHLRGLATPNPDPHPHPNPNPNPIPIPNPNPDPDPNPNQARAAARRQDLRHQPPGKG